MEIEHVRSLSDVETCVDLYLDLDPSLPADRAHAIKVLSALARRKGFFRILKKEGNIIGAITAQEVQSMHSPLISLQQTYYFSMLAGISAGKAVILAHNALEAEAIDRGLPMISSYSSHHDTTFVMTRILEKIGWERHGYFAYKFLN